jgi:hypothetical protein
MASSYFLANLLFVYSLAIKSVPVMFVDNLPSPSVNIVVQQMKDFQLGS